MIPLALALYWVEIWVLSRILIEVKQEAIPALDLVRSRDPASLAATRTKGRKPSVL